MNKYRWTGESGNYLTHGKVYEVEYTIGKYAYFIDDSGKHFWAIDTTAEYGWELVNDSPVREVTVTRREIVPGNYGVVKIHYHDETELIVNLTKKRLTAEEMRDAAHVLNQIAEVLEDAS